jgi:glucose-6-phosphate 1-dehydrogenase
MHGQQTLLPHSAWIYRAWAIVELLLEQWEAVPPPELPNYVAGTWGPAAADRLLARDGRAWLEA